MIEILRALGDLVSLVSGAERAEAERLRDEVVRLLRERDDALRARNEAQLEAEAAKALAETKPPR